MNQRLLSPQQQSIDLVRGAEAIGEAIKLNRDQVYRLAAKGRRQGGIPIFRDDTGELCAHRSSLRAYYEEKERRALRGPKN